MATSKTNWKSFFTFEKQLLAFISQQKILAGNKDDLSYKETPYKNSILERPPKFIHAIVSLQDNTETFKKVETDIEELKRLYLAVSNKANYPSRFPQLLTPTPLQINLSQHEAYRSHVVSALLKDDFILVKRYRTNDQVHLVNADIAALDNIGIKTEVSDKFGKILSVSINDLIYYANTINTAKSLTVRQLSGMQYTARVRYPDSFVSVRMSYSLLIVRSDIPVLESLPQGRRTHRLETTKEKLVLPIKCDAEIFIKEN